MAEVVIKVGLDTADIKRGADKAAADIRSGLNGAASGAQQAGKRIADALTSNLNDAARRIGQTLQSVGNKLSIGLTLPLTALGAASIKAAADIDKSRQTLAALTGSVDSANRKLAELRQLAATSPGVTVGFASSLFAQFKALGQVADESINRVIQSIGKLNAVFTLQDADQFARNIQQIFTQGFERADIKEALGQVPIFEQILEQAFGTKDAEKLRQLKEAGKLTMTTWLDGLSNAINTDPRFANVQESIASRFAKTKDAILTALAPLGDSILRTLQPVLESIIPKIIELLDKFAKLPPAVQESIVIFGLFAVALGPVLSGLGSLISLITSLTGLISGGGGLIAAFTGLNPVMLGIGGLLVGGAIAWYEYSRAVNTASAQIDIAVRKARESTGEFINLKGESVTRTGNKFIDVRAAQAQLPSGPVSLSVDFNAVDKMTGAPRVQPNAPTTPTIRPTGGGGGGGGSTAKTISELDQLRERLAAVNREIAVLRDPQNAEFQLRIQIDKAEKTRTVLQELLELRQLLGVPINADFANAEEQLQVLLKLKGGLEEVYKKTPLAAQLPGVTSTGPDALSPVQPLPQNLIDEQNRNRQAIEQANVARVNTLKINQQIAQVQNAIDTGVIFEADGRRQINALLREQRDLRQSQLQAELQMSGISDERRAEINLELESIRNMGVELTNAQRFMRGFGAAVEDVGDIFDRFGNNVARAFTSIKGLLGNLKNAVVQFFRDLVGNSLQRIVGGVLNSVFGGLFGSSAGGAGGAGRSGGGVGSAIGAALGGFGGGGASAVGVGSAARASGALLGGFSGGGGLLDLVRNAALSSGPAAPTGAITPPFNGGIFAPANQGNLGGLGTGAAGGVLGNLGNLFQGIGFGLPPGATRGALAGALPLLGLSLGSSLGGQSRLGNILGGAGGALLGVGLTAAPAALAGGALGFLAPLFSNPFTAIAGAALLPVAWLLGRSKQRKADEEQSGIWLQAAIDQIMALKEPAKAGQLTKDQAKQIFESQILATFTSLIQTLKTKSVRKSRLTNQVRDLRNLFETEVLALAPDKLTQKSKSSLNLIPEFATGGVVRGVDRGVDSVLAYVRPGEMVLTQAHQDAVKAVAGNDVFARVGVPNAPQSTVNGAPAFASGGVVPMRGGVSDAPIEINLAVGLNVSKAEAGRIVALGASSGDGRRVVINQVRRANFDGV